MKRSNAPSLSVMTHPWDAILSRTYLVPFSIYQTQMKITGASASVRAARPLADFIGQKTHKALGNFLPFKFYFYDQTGKVRDFKSVNMCVSTQNVYVIVNKDRHGHSLQPCF